MGDVVTKRLEALAQVVRAPLVAVTFVFVLLGVGSAGVATSAYELAAILLASLGFHVAVYVVNDVVDLEIDRTEPRRAGSPLVRGTVTRSQMCTLAGLSAAAGVAVLATLSVRAAVALTVATVALLVYDVWGKRCPLPALTDLVQGLGWAALLVAGAFAVGDPTAATWWLSAYVTVAILLVNGVHGSMRDLANDQRHGARTMARTLGARVDDDGRFVIPVALWVYAVGLHVADVLLLLIPSLAGDLRSTATAAFIVVGGTVCLGALWLGLRRAGDRRLAMNAGFVYLIIMLLLPASLVVDQLDGNLLVVFVVVFVAPWAGSTFVRSQLRRRSKPGVDAGAQAGSGAIVR